MPTTGMQSMMSGAARREGQAGHFRRIAEQFLEQLRDQHGAGIQHKAKEKHGGGGNREIAIFQHAEIDDGIFGAEFPDHASNTPMSMRTRKKRMKSGREPVFALAFVQDDLHAAEAQADEAEADVIDAEAFLQS